MPPMQLEEHDEEVSAQDLEDSECGPLAISKLEVSCMLYNDPANDQIFIFMR